MRLSRGFHKKALKMSSPRELRPRLDIPCQDFIQLSNGWVAGKELRVNYPNLDIYIYDILIYTPKIGFLGCGNRISIP